MQCKTLVSLSLSLLLGLLASTAHAEIEMTRQQVKAELAEAMRMGGIPVNEGGSSARDVNPSAYPRRPVVAGKTRAEVKAELLEALCMGEIPNYETGLRPRDLNPSFYPPEPK